MLSLARAAEILGISRATAYNWASQGRLPVVRHGERGVRVPRAALDAWQTAEAEAALENLEPSR